MEFFIEKIEKPSNEIVVGDEIENGEVLHIVNRVEKRENDVVLSTTILDDNPNHTSRAILVIPKKTLVTIHEIVIKRD